MDIIQKVYNNFDSSFIEKINAISTTQCISKNNYYLKEGQINKQLAIINTGYLQSFFNKNGVEITTYLAGPGETGRFSDRLFKPKDFQRIYSCTY